MYARLDARTQAAVERKFEIIGEAVTRPPAAHPELANRIPDNAPHHRFPELSEAWL